jgi:hypothetical protein
VFFVVRMKRKINVSDDIRVSDAMRKAIQVLEQSVKRAKGKSIPFDTRVLACVVVVNCCLSQMYFSTFSLVVCCFIVVLCAVSSLRVRRFTARIFIDSLYIESTSTSLRRLTIPFNQIGSGRVFDDTSSILYESATKAINSTRLLFA